MRHQSIALAASLLGSALALAAFQNPAPEQKANPLQDDSKSKQVATLKGRVVNSETNEALKKVTLILARSNSGSTTSKTETDDKGEFTFENLAPGRYGLYAERTGYTRQAYGARGSALNGTSLTFTAGQEVRDLVFKLQPNSVISGRVLDADGDPIPQTMVMALRVMYDRGKKQFLPLATAQTNDLGEYRLASLKAGRYFISATPLNIGIGLAGTSNKAPSDKPERANVMTFYPNSREREGASSVEVGSGAETRGIDIRMVQVDTVRVKGKLDTAAGKQALVYLAPKGAGISGLISRYQTMGLAQPDGTFEIKSVAPGSYTLGALGIDGMSSLGTPQAIEVADKHISGVVLQTNGNGELPGTFQIEGKSTVPKDAQIAIEPLEIFSASPPRVTVGEDGKFTLKDVPPDRYVVHAIGAGAEGLYLKSVKYNGLPVGEDGVDLSAGVKGSIDVIMSDRGGSVDGVATDADGQPMSGATVVLIPASGKFSQYEDMTSDQKGRFNFKSVTPGDYKLLAWEDIDTGAYQDPEFVKAYLGRAEPVSLRESEHKSATVKVIPIEKTPAR